MRPTLLLLAALITTTAQAQWDLQTSNTTASLRGIHALDNGVAWASGTNGTVLHTTDDGAHWLACSTPPNAEALDFRGIQAFDAQTAIVMSSGRGDLSRLYKTTDACKTWTLLFTNPDKEGFWDAISARLSADRKSIYAMIAGDPVSGSFTLFQVQIPIRSGYSPVLMPFPGPCRDTPHRQTQPRRPPIAQKPVKPPNAQNPRPHRRFPLRIYPFQMVTIKRVQRTKSPCTSISASASLDLTHLF